MPDSQNYLQNSVLDLFVFLQSTLPSFWSPSERYGGIPLCCILNHSYTTAHKSATQPSWMFVRLASLSIKHGGRMRRENWRCISRNWMPIGANERIVSFLVQMIACVAGRRKGGKSKWTREGEAREGEGTACKDAIVFFVFFVHQTNVKILIGQI